MDTRGNKAKPPDIIRKHIRQVSIAFAVCLPNINLIHCSIKSSLIDCLHLSNTACFRDVCEYLMKQELNTKSSLFIKMYYLHRTLTTIPHFWLLHGKQVSRTISSWNWWLSTPNSCLSLFCFLAFLATYKSEQTSITPVFMKNKLTMIWK